MLNDPGRAAALALAAALAACGQEQEMPAEVPARPAEQERTNGGSIVAGPDLRPSGKGLGPGLPFGTERTAVVAAATASHGQPTGEDRIEECGEGPMEFVRFGGLSLAFQDDRFVGWFARAPYRARMAGVLRVGDPAGKVGAARIEETTLGAEFELPDGTRGILDEERKAVEALWAGSACLFR